MKLSTEKYYFSFMISSPHFNVAELKTVLKFLLRMTLMRSIYFLLIFFFLFQINLCPFYFFLILYRHRNIFKKNLKQTEGDETINSKMKSLLNVGYLRLRLICSPIFKLRTYNVEAFVLMRRYLSQPKTSCCYIMVQDNLK
jgi:hypothetical protein